MAHDPRFDSNVYGDNERKMRKRKRRRGLKLTVRKGGRRWTLKTMFKSKASRARAKRGLATLGWR
tara:strand:+ start:223 stop:417 length:195 start_codon:yes stop_codon:yes gene_type:complete